MLYAKKSKKTNKHYLCYTDVYGSLAFPSNDMLNNRILFMYGGIEIKMPDGEKVLCRTMNEIQNLLKLLNESEEIA